MNLLAFEDSPKKIQSIVELINMKLNHQLGISISMTIRTDDHFLETDLMTNNFSMILIDDDLGNNLTGQFVIERIIDLIDSTPECKSVPIVYYSAGTSVEELKAKSISFGNIPCVSFQDLADFIINYIFKQKSK